MDLLASGALPVPRLRPGGIMMAGEETIGQQNLAVVEGKGGSGGGGEGWL